LSPELTGASELSNKEQISQRAIDADRFWSALGTNLLDECLAAVRRPDHPGTADPSFDCRLAEALMQVGRRAEAVECCRRAFPAVQVDAPLLRICAWVFSNCACHDEAAATYRRLIELCPDWIDGHRHASGSLAAAGRFDEAMTHATTASALFANHSCQPVNAERDLPSIAR